MRRMRIAGSLLATGLACASPALADPAIWVVSSPTAKVYLFGTMHILPKKVDWFGPKIAAAFGESAVLVEEADVGLTNPDALTDIMAKAMAPDSDIWSKLSPGEAAKFRAQLQKCHLPDEVVAHFKPWFASMLPTICGLMDSAGGDALTMAGNGPEAALIARAKDSGKTLDFFETADQQISYLASAPDSVQIKELESAIDEGDSGGDEFTGMEKSWAAGDVGAIAKLVATMRDKGTDFYDLIFTQRNARFAARIATFLQGSKTVFVAIGAGHLAGPDSVQAQLAKQHIDTKQL